ncbi:craniofacial development protein 2-like [Diorhabda carinulata]|uniref:craniofacial development protein 2-like n=1 Tax=Diorhabda carinulata TaxID=1163345 RepID=UPI0025A2D40C|nr:craniofacial development protein 2-like [Diorhabda carinulata]
MIELKDHRIDICALQETKKKGNGQQIYDDYMVIYSGVSKDERAKEGVALAIHKKYTNSIEECQYTSSRILIVKLRTETQLLNIISIYAPEDNKPKQERESFYEQLQNITESLPQNESIIILGDFNARIGNEVIPGVKQRFNENILNDNGELLMNLCSLCDLRINNTFFDLKPQYKSTFRNSRGQQSTIDYIVTNRHIHPAQIQEVRTLNSANAGSDHSLLLGKIKMKLNLGRNREPRAHTEKINIESMWDTTIKELYKNRLKGKIDKNPIEENDDINNSWKRLKENIIEAASESLGTRTIRPQKQRTNKTLWFSSKVKEQCKKKKKAYLNYMSSQTAEAYKE